MTAKKILIIDDDHDLLVGLTTRLKASGYGVVCASDGISAVSVARTQTPDLVILDLGLPGGDGFLVLERIRSLRDLTVTPVIVLSALDPTDNKKRALDSGAIAFFHKPPEMNEFLSTIRDALGETNALSTFLST